MIKQQSHLVLISSFYAFADPISEWLAFSLSNNFTCFRLVDWENINSLIYCHLNLHQRMNDSSRRGIYNE